MCLAIVQTLKTEDGESDPRVWVIIDGKAPCGQFDEFARTVVLTSPSTKNWNEFAKGG